MLDRLKGSFLKCCPGKAGNEWKKKISKHELQELIKELSKSLKGIDLNGDNILSRDEMFKFVAKVYASVI